MKKSMKSNKKIVFIMILIGVYTLISGLLLIYTTANLYGILCVLQNILIPIFVTRFLLKDIKTYYHSHMKSTGAFIGAASAFIPTTLMIAVPIILIYINYGERVNFSEKLGLATIMISGVITWAGLLILSAFLGLLATICFRKD